MNLPRHCVRTLDLHIKHTFRATNPNPASCTNRVPFRDSEITNQFPCVTKKLPLPEMVVTWLDQGIEALFKVDTAGIAVFRCVINFLPFPSPGESHLHPGDFILASSTCWVMKLLGLPDLDGEPPLQVLCRALPLSHILSLGHQFFALA